MILDYDEISTAWLCSVRVLHGRLEGDPRDGAVLGALLPGLHHEGGEAAAPRPAGLLQVLQLGVFILWCLLYSCRKEGVEGGIKNPRSKMHFLKY